MSIRVSWEQLTPEGPFAVEGIAVDFIFAHSGTHAVIVHEGKFRTIPIDHLTVVPDPRPTTPHPLGAKKVFKAV